MRLQEIIQGLDMREIHADTATEIGGITGDSRQVKPGDLFVAVRGFSSDGHAYIPKAAEMGCAAVLCEELRKPFEGGGAALLRHG